MVAKIVTPRTPGMYIKPFHVRAGFVNRCLDEEKVVPFFLGDEDKFSECFSGLIRSFSEVFSISGVSGPAKDRYFRRYVWPCLKPPISKKFRDSVCYQASVKLARELEPPFPVLLKARAIEAGSDFYDVMVCDAAGREGRTTRIEPGYLENMF